MSDDSLDEKIRRYWIGKKPITKQAIEEYIKNDGKISQQKIAKKYNLNPGTITIHIRALRKLGVKTPTIPKTICCLCKKTVQYTWPKYIIHYGEDSANKHIVAYLCCLCGDKMGIPTKPEFRETTMTKRVVKNVTKGKI